MPIEPFPARVFPRKLCHREGEINSVIPLSKLLRLSEYLHDNHGQAEICLSFDTDESGYCHVHGTVSAQVNLICQRCLECTEVNLTSGMDIKVAETEKQARQIAETSVDPLHQMEIVVCDEGQLDLLLLVEDELIMSLPIVAMHNNIQCNESLNALHEKANSLGNAASSNIKGLEKLEALKEALKQDSKSGQNTPGKSKMSKTKKPDK